MVCRCDLDMYLPAADDKSPVQKNPRCDRRAREPVFLETPAGFALTYAGVIARSGRYAGALAELGLKSGDRVAEQVEKSVEVLMLYLGAIRAGAIFLPLDTPYASAETPCLRSNKARRLDASRA
ncbi:MAG: AMP-binding protein [Methylocella sp.]